MHGLISIMLRDRPVDRSKVLVVCGSMSQRMLLHALLSDHSYTPLLAVDGHEAEQIVRQQMVGLALVDWELRDGTGPDLIHHWRRDPVLDYTQSIIMTSHNEPERIRRALALGAVDFLHKPVEPVELLARLRSAQRARELQNQLILISFSDPLTKLSNRRCFEECYEYEQERHRISHKPLSVAIFDIDKFKLVNDNHGHDVGDVVLQQFGTYLRSHVRANDVLARFGGEEFVMLLPGTPLDEAYTFIDGLRAGMADAQWGKPNNPLKVSFSGGVTCNDFSANRPPASLHDLLKRADSGLYMAKEQGRNRVFALPFVDDLLCECPVEH